MHSIISLKTLNLHHSTPFPTERNLGKTSLRLYHLFLPILSRGDTTPPNIPQSASANQNVQKITVKNSTTSVLQLPLLKREAFPSVKDI